MISIPRFAKIFDGFETIDFKEYLEQRRVEVHLTRREDKEFRCHRCGEELKGNRGRHKIKLETLSVMGLRCFVHLWRMKGDCKNCKKTRSEKIDFISQPSPHLTDDYSHWLGRMTEVAAVTRVADLMGQDPITVWRIDYARLKYLLQHYKIPEATMISVDEVYARKKAKYEGESRDKRFFTVVSDLKTRRVIWTSESRAKEGLDQFFILIGKEACEKIKVVAMDQHEAYMASVNEHCKNATIVWDRFHLMQNFEEAVNDTRKMLHDEQAMGSDLKRLTRGQFRFLFLKKANARTAQEKIHIDSVLENNKEFMRLELIKERMVTFFHQPDEPNGRKVFDEIGDWIWQAGFKPLMKWHDNLEKGWDTLKNYFSHKVSSSLSEGINNVIKMLKRRAFGYRNMEYFRLKIMQFCGYLNSRYVPTRFQPLTQKC